MSKRYTSLSGRHFLSASQLSEDLHKRLFMIALLFVGRRADPVVPPSLPPSLPPLLPPSRLPLT
jgi:hypothetical protein